FLRRGHQLLGEERVTLRARVHLIDKPRRRRPAYQGGDLVCHLLPAQRAQPYLLHCPAAAHLRQPPGHLRIQPRLIAPAPHPPPPVTRPAASTDKQRQQTKRAPRAQTPPPDPQPSPAPRAPPPQQAAPPGNPPPPPPPLPAPARSGPAWAKLRQQPLHLRPHI